MTRKRLAGFTLLAALLLLSTAALAETRAATPKTASPMVDLELKDVTVKDAIAKLFENTDLTYTLQPGVTGRVVELKLRGITLDQALKSLADAADLTWQIKDGVYVIGPKPIVRVEPTTATDQAGENVTQPSDMPLPDEASQAPPQQVIINQAQGPVFYGHLPRGPVGIIGDGPLWHFGNVSVYGRYYPRAVISGYRVFAPAGFGFRPPPPYGYLSTDVRRFLANEYALTARPGFASPYGY